jgi:protein dithiol oxidoreductase (disulfide-forming)
MPRPLRPSVLVYLSAILLFIPLQLRAVDEGIDYSTLKVAQPTETGDQVEVLEVFWYSCPHCWHLEPAMQSWVATLPAGAAFRRLPGADGRLEPHARAYYAAELMGKLDVLHPALFKAIHGDKRALWTEDALVEFAGQIGLDEREFREAFNSFAVDAKVRKAQDMSRRYGIDGVPAVIVNGKYRTSPSQAGDQDRFIEVMNTLVARELAAKGAAAAQ